ncbi:uncharacterized protein A1O5_09268 [Cladophialophora psammophila CBS 110553]|uniref:tripeptidyl-peptidase II n=1 Tax=Cladophialophora psammophila CBS 110553 TaxID=1182543 RepID=W9WTG5_9EURO|nr:uncharacterized protein A1O5_09268 [Cladophialophora psammophila CBS 110553]EXJ67921.1 hypothetical protein A1O5_09268 [Cladophialophora psammophila CBS 110553]
MLRFTVRSLVLCALALLASSIANAGAPDSDPELRVFEQLADVPDGWDQGEPAPASARLKLRIAIRQDDKYAFLQEQLLRISDPEHELYGQHYDAHSLNALMRPEPAVSNAVLSWLEAQGVDATDIEDNGDWITVVASVAQAETLLDTRFDYFHNRADNSWRIRTLQYSIPDSLHPYIQTIQPTTHFARSRPAQQPGPTTDSIPVYGSATKLNATYCNTTTSPDCIRALYGLGNFRANASSGSRLGIPAFASQNVVRHDLALFVGKWASYARGANFSITSVNGGVNNQSTDAAWASEANMDVQYGLTLSYPTPVHFYKVGGRGPLIYDLQQPDIPGALNEQEPFLEYLQYMLNLTNEDLPQVISISYAEDEQSHPLSYMLSVCQLFAKLGARGVSVLASSGDGGPGDGCMTNDGRNATRFMPQFPASCPWVTSVGGTGLVQPEIAEVMSGGGFSDVFARPAYQREVVEAYLNGTVKDKFKGLYNRTGRAIPDVAAQAWITFPIFHLGVEQLSGGTSAATPTWAAIVANVNSVRMSKGHKPLGFLNPWLYGKGYKALTDITQGSSRGCESTTASGLDAPEVPGAGWKATVGWDAATGLGTPNFTKLLNLVGGMLE